MSVIAQVFDSHRNFAKIEINQDFLDSRGAVAQSVERPKGPNLVQLYLGFVSRCTIRVRAKILAAPSSSDISSDINTRGLGM